MSVSEDHLIWIDLEMTGLDTLHDRIIEIALVITDTRLNVIAEGPDIAIHQSDAILEGMDAWNQKHHSQSGLIKRVKQSMVNEQQAQAECLSFLSQHVPAKISPMCGNSICQDRRFLAKHMPELEDYFHYRHIDVTTVKILCQRLRPDIASQCKKRTTHQALQDIYDSIEELRFMYQHFLNI